MNTDPPTCGECRFWVGNRQSRLPDQNPQRGDCRAQPPTLHPRPYDQYPAAWAGRWPWTYDHYWCAYFTEIKETT